MPEITASQFQSKIFFGFSLKRILQLRFFLFFCAGLGALLYLIDQSHGFSFFALADLVLRFLLVLVGLSVLSRYLGQCRQSRRRSCFCAGVLAGGLCLFLFDPSSVATVAAGSVLTAFGLCFFERVLERHEDESRHFGAGFWLSALYFFVVLGNPAEILLFYAAVFFMSLFLANITAVFITWQSKQ